MAKKAAKKPVKEDKKKKTTPAKKEKPAKVEKKKAKSKKPSGFADDGLVIIDEEFEEDKEAELEARKAYLEEARSQEVED